MSNLTVLGRVKLIMISLFLGLLTWFSIGALMYLPNSDLRNALSDALRLPGALLASIFYPQGTHTGGGSAGAIYVGVAGNTGVYAVLWLVAIQTVRMLRKRSN
jgi:hypothetical protein